MQASLGNRSEQKIDGYIKKCPGKKLETQQDPKNYYKFQVRKLRIELQNFQNTSQNLSHQKPTVWYICFSH